MPTTLEERIKAQAEKLKQLKALKGKQEARKRAEESKKTRTDDTRRKILVGAMVLEQIQKNEPAKAEMMRKLDAFLVRDDERFLFGLAPKAAQPKTNEKTTEAIAA